MARARLPANGLSPARLTSRLSAAAWMPVCAPGYRGRKRGEVVRTRTTVLQAHTQEWLGTFSNPGSCHTGAVILRAIQAQGYQGGASTVLAYITQLRKAAGIPPMRRVGVAAAPISDPAQQVPSSRELSWLVLRRSEKLETKEQTQLEQLGASGVAMQAGIQLAQEFATMLRERQPEKLDAWLTRTEASGLAPLVSFANGIRKDYAAVKAGLTLEWSNGPTEGHISFRLLPNWLWQVCCQIRSTWAFTSAMVVIRPSAAHLACTSSSIPTLAKT